MTDRRAWADSPSSPDTHARLFSALPCLHAVEVTAPPASPRPQTHPPSAAATARVVWWNAERLKAPQAAATLLKPLAPDVILLGEVDRGMARSGNQCTLRALGDALNYGTLFGVEFVELGLGDRREQRQHAGEDNIEGLHGNAILSPRPLGRPGLIRLDDSGAWFTTAQRGQRRIGGRMALVTTIMLAAQEVVMVAVHLESHSSPHDRAQSLGRLLDAVDRYAGTRPVLIGGDLNTCTLHRPRDTDAASRRAWADRDPDRFRDPVPHEPLFAIAAAHGYAWESFNVPRTPTQRSRADGTPEPPFAKLDWFLGRGLVAVEAGILPALDPISGHPLSDHEALTVTVRLADPSHGAALSPEPRS